MTYALLIYTSRPGDQVIDPAENETALVAHRAVQAEASAAGDLLAVAKLDLAHTAQTARYRRSGAVVTDGPFAETKEWLAGFYLVECDSEAQALERAKALCAIDEHSVEVRPVDWRWDG